MRSGAIGEVREVHLVANAFNYSRISYIPQLRDDHPVPETLDWDLWLGPAPYRKFNPTYHQFYWRSWRQFSSGMVGDFFCHLADPVFWALELDAPTSVLAEAEGYDPKEHVETFPQSVKIRFEFPAKGSRPPVTMYWYEGDRYGPPRPEELADEEEFIPVPSWSTQGGATGGLVVGDKGKIIYGSHGATQWRIIPESKMKDYIGARSKAPDPRGSGMPDASPHHSEWLKACRGEGSTGSDFDYGSRLSEIGILGEIAQRIPGTELQWDSKHMMFTNHPEMNGFLHYRYRDGWTL